MQTLSRYLNPKAQWHPSDLSFPDNPVTNDIISFLESYGYKRLENKLLVSENMIDYVNYIYKHKEGKNYFIHYDHPSKKGCVQIYFFSGGDISADNPAVLINTEETGKVNYNEYFAGVIINSVTSVSSTARANISGRDNFRYFSELKSSLNKIFGWK